MWTILTILSVLTFNFIFRGELAPDTKVMMCLWVYLVGAIEINGYRKNPR